MNPLASFELEYPAAVLLLALAPVVVWLGWRRRQRPVSISLLLLLLVCLIFALAQPIWRSSSAATSRYLLLIDQSPSLGDESSEKARVLREQLEQQSAEITAQNFESNAAEALRSACITADEAAQVVLFTDGRGAEQELLRVAAGAQRPLHMVSLTAFPWPEVSLLRIETPVDYLPGRPFLVQCHVSSSSGGKGLLRLELDSANELTRELTLSAGETVVNLPVTLHEPMAGSVLTARLENFADRIAENNIRRTVLYPAPGPNILLASAITAGNAKSIPLKPGAKLTMVSPEQLAGSAESLSEFDVVVLNNIQAGDLGETQSTALKKYVQEFGGGLVVAGGQDVFARQRYAGSALEQLLPVVAQPEQQARQRTLALTLVIDKSQSMEEEGKLELAISAAQQTIDLLSPEDQVGVLAFGSSTQWVSPLGKSGEKAAIKQRLAALQAEGKTNMAPALERALFALSQTEADRRHLIVLTDGVSAPGDFDELARRVADAGISVSTVSVTDDADQTILKHFADIAGGKHFHCSTANEIPKILTAETKSAVEAVAVIAVTPSPLRELPRLNINEAPPLAGYAATNPRGEAEVLLTAGEGDPLLAWQRVGQGITVAFTAPLFGGAAEPWREWTGYRDFWQRIIEHAARGPAASEHIWIEEKGDGTFTLLADVADSTGAYQNDAKVSAVIKGPTNSDSLPLVLAAPGRYSLELPSREPGRYEVTVSLIRPGGAKKTISRGYCVDYDPVLSVGPARKELLRQAANLSGGLFNPTAEELLANQTASAPREYSLAPWFLLAVLVLLVCEVGWRRMYARQ